MPKKRYKQTEAHKKKLSDKKKGIKRKPFSDKTKKKMSIAKSGKNHPMYGKHMSEESKDKMRGKNNPNYGVRKYGKNSPSWKKDNNIKYGAIHIRAHKVQPKPADGKCAICNQIADKTGITKLVHSNKDHTYKLPINPDEWWWIHESCHKEYDLPTRWTPERRKAKSEEIKKSWSPERRKEQSERWKKDNPMRRPEIIEKVWTPERRKEQINRMKGNKYAKKSKKPINPKAINSGQVDYWLKII